MNEPQRWSLINIPPPKEKRKPRKNQHQNKAFALLSRRFLRIHFSSGCHAPCIRTYFLVVSLFCRRALMAAGDLVCPGTETGTGADKKKKDDTLSPVSLVRVKFSRWRAPLLSFPAIRRSFREMSSQFTTSSRPGSSTGAAAQPPVLSIAAAVLYLAFEVLRWPYEGRVRL